MKSYRPLIPTLLIALAALLLGSLLPLSKVLSQDGQPPAGAQAVASPDIVDTVLGSAFTYQGSLKQNGQPVDASCSFQFSLWDADSGGNQKGTTQTLNNTEVQAGVFTVQLDFGAQFTGDARWLESSVQCPGDAGYTPLLPRQPITAAPYAIGLRPGAVMQSAEAGDAFYVEKTATNSNAIHGKSTATGSIGVWGEGVDNTGVYGLSQGGRGVWGASTSESGVYGISDSWAGVWGESTGASGVVGMSASQYSAGVWGENTGQGYGVYGKSPDNVGVKGESTSWAGVWGDSTGASGVVGVSAGQFNGGVYGENTGEGYGVYGKSPDGLGVYGQSTASIGVYGKSTSQTGVVGESSSHDGVRGTATAVNRIGVKGVANATGAVGVWGESATNTGVYGQSGAANSAALWGKNTAGGIALKAEGNAVQSRDRGGLIKAMALIEAINDGGSTDDAYIVRCYSGVTGDSFAGGGCGGFDATTLPTGSSLPDKVLVDFGFPVNDRFIMVNAFDAGGTVEISRFLYIEEISGNTVTVHNNRKDCSSGGTFCLGEQMDFFIFVY